MRHLPLFTSFILLFSAFTVSRAAPEKVLIIGDSMMKVTAHATQLALRKQDGVTARAEPSIGSGLARLDALDWMAKAEKLVTEFEPDVTMVWFGTNDVQPMQSSDGLLQPGQPAWMTEYAKRMGEMMDILTQREGAVVYWLELPVMRDNELNQYVRTINQVAKALAGQRENVIFFETNKLLTRKPDTFSAYLVDKMGKPIKVREPDGIHLARAGADLVAEAFVNELF